MVSINNNNDSIFSLFPQYNLEQAITVKKTDTNAITNPLNEKDTITVNNSNKTSKSKKRKFIFGSTLASSILTAGIIGLIFAKGVHGSSFQKLSKYADKMAKDVQQQNITGKKIGYLARKGTKKTVDTMQATSNFTAIKDYIANKLFRTNKATEKFADSSTSFFKRIVDKTLGKKYDKVEIKVKDLTSLLKQFKLENMDTLSQKDLSQKINIKGTVKTLKEWLEILSKQSERLESTFDNNFSLGARRLRDKKRQKLLADLPQKIGERFFKSKKQFLSPETYKTYATQDLTKAAQEELQNGIIKAKRQVSNNIPTIHDNIKNSLSSFINMVLPEDEASQKSISMLKEQLKKFKTCSGADEAKAREKISKQIISVIDDLIKMTKKNANYNPSQQEEMLKYLTSAKESVMSTGVGSKGSLEEIMTVLKGLNQAGLKSSGHKIVSDGSFKEFSKLSKSISKGIEKAADLEAGEYFLKQAELKVGSAPTDVLSVFFPIGVGAYSIAKGDDKDEKISATLTTCIPLVGTFATFVYGTVKMLSGAKNLAFSLVSGFILSQLGRWADKLYKKYKDTGSVVNVVKDEYDKFWTGLAPQFDVDDTKETKNKK